MIRNSPSIPKYTGKEWEIKPLDALSFDDVLKKVVGTVTQTPTHPATEIPACLVNSIQCGDSEFVLKQLPNNSVDLVVTSPPYYQQRSYNNGQTIGDEVSVEKYTDSLMDVFREVVRVVKPSGNIVYNLGDKYVNKSLLLVPFRFAIKATTQESVILVNNITWAKSNPTPRQFDRRLVSSTEPFFHFAKGSDYYYDRDVFFENKDRERLHKASPKIGQGYRQKIDGSDLSAEEKRDAHQSLDKVIKEAQSGQIQSFRMKIRGVHAEAFGGEQGGRNSQIRDRGFTIIRLYGRAMKKDVMHCAVESVPNIRHTAMYPETIIRELVKMLAPDNGIVLDPYMGSGTTALAAMREGRRFVGIDIEPSYCELANNRISNYINRNA
ncbi:MAG: site-specific DNA-methyltransferase [Bacteroidetes bacterium]|nr:site-specific DNA-methyltransferase [Bacteroidota bacterium]